MLTALIVSQVLSWGVILALVVAMLALESRLHRLEYETFMLQ